MKKIIVILYGVFLLLFAAFSYAFIDPNFFYFKNIYSGFSLSNRLLTTILYISSILISFVFYCFFIYLGIRRKISYKEILILLGITVGILFFSYPAILSYDIFNYIATSKVLFFYHENPYVIMPVELIGDSILNFTHAANKVALYGPVWIALSGIPHFLGFGNFILTLLLFKLFIASFYLATVFIIWKISKSTLSVIMFAFNPLVVIETLVSSHNDIVMIFFTLSSFFLLMKKKIIFAILLFVFSIFIKYTTIFLIPIFIYILWKMIMKLENDWKNVFYLSFLAMFLAFLLSPIREEIYPWYAIWFISFIFLITKKYFLVKFSIFFSFTLLLRYIPYMISGTYIGQTPLFKEIISFSLPLLYSLYYVLKKKI